MNIPSTHQDSPKVPEAEKRTLCLKCGEAVGGPGNLGCNLDPNRGHSGPFRTETYIPVSALLSDEARKDLAAFDDHGDYEAPVQALRDLLSAIEQVGGAKRAYAEAKTHCEGQGDSGGGE